VRVVAGDQVDFEPSFGVVAPRQPGVGISEPLGMSRSGVEQRDSARVWLQLIAEPGPAVRQSYPLEVRPRGPPRGPSRQPPAKRVPCPSSRDRGTPPEVGGPTVRARVQG